MKSLTFPEESCIHQLFEARAAAAPERTAVVFEGRGLTYGELDSRANLLAGYLRRQGVGPEVLVGIVVERSLEMLVGLLAILKAGGAFVPLSPDDPPERLRSILEQTRISLLLTQEALLPALPPGSFQIFCLDRDWERLPTSPLPVPPSGVRAENLAYVIFTSGSTGRPKGVMVSHRNVVGFLHAFRDVTRDSVGRVGTNVAPFNFDTSVEEFWSCLCFGGTVHIVRPENSTDGAYFARYLAEHGITTTYIVPLMLPEVAAHLAAQLPRLRLRCLLTGLHAKKERALQAFRDLLPGLRIINAYGPTETTYGATAFEFHQTSDPDRDVPIGVPFPGYQAYILDARNQSVPVGVAGELYVGGVGIARGYLGQPELTRRAFVPDPWGPVPGSRLYRTGDRCRFRSDGVIEFLGRTDQQVKIRGYRVELEEVENALAGLPAVRECAVAAIPDANGLLRLVGYVVGRSLPSAKDLRAVLATSLPHYMIPSVFVPLAALPRTSSGKLDRQSLPPPDPDRLHQRNMPIAPRTPLERLLAGIWEEVLNTLPVRCHDNFFDLGGNSLLATQIASRIGLRLGVRLRLQAVLSAPTVAELAAVVGRLVQATPAAPAAAPPVTRLKREEYRRATEGRLDEAEVYLFPASFAQQRLWLLDQLGAGTAYTIAHGGAFRIGGPLDVAALGRSLAEIVRRHESLRTTFTAEDGRLSQVVVSTAALDLSEADLGGLPAGEREAEALRRAAAAAERPFDLERGPLLRVLLLRLGAQEHLLLLTMHHIVSDGWSMGVLFRELSALYAAFLAGRPSPLPALPIQYPDFAVWQRRWLDGAVLEEQLRHWKQRLAGITELRLPIDRPRPAQREPRAHLQPIALSPETTTALQELGRGEGATLFMVLLAAFQALLARQTAQEDVVVGSPIANRNRVEIEGLIGCFANMLVLRGDLSGDPTFRELLGRVREVCLGAYSHQDLPFEKLVEALRPRREPDRNPLFQAAFTLMDVLFPMLGLEGLEVTPFDPGAPPVRFDLECNLRIREGRIDGLFLAAADLFDAATVGDLAGRYRLLLEGIAADPDRPLSRISLLTPEERAEILGTWNDTATPYPRVCVLDRTGDLVPPGMAGELSIAEDDLARGCLNALEPTAGRFVPDPFSPAPGARLCRSGYLVRARADGVLEALGRVDEQVKVRRRPSEPREVEAALRKHPAVKDVAVRVERDAHGLECLVASVVEHPAAAAASREVELVELRRNLMNSTYEQRPVGDDPGFNIVGWNSSYTGAPIPEEQMREWVEETLRRIVRERPTRILEIGCGTGLLLLRLAPGCAHYRGTDLSQVALDLVRESLGRLGLREPCVSLSRQAADDFAGIAPGAFDAVVLNSVLQYFPDEDYLLRVLEGAARALAPGGVAFIGDIRNLALLEAFQISVELAKAPPETNIAQLRERVRTRLDRETELLLDPLFIATLPRRLPAFAAAEIWPKQGLHGNELTKFRFDALLYRESPPRPASEITWHDAAGEALHEEAVRRLLAATGSGLVGLRGVADPRLAGDLRAAAQLRRSPPEELVENARLLLEAPAAGISPARLRELGREWGLATELGWPGPGREGSFDVVFFPEGSDPPRCAFPGVQDAGAAQPSGEKYANVPFLQTTAPDRSELLRSFLRERLPDRMIPASFEFLPELPPTDAGEGGREAPRDDLETRLAAAWERVLEVGPVGIRDDFFDLGGHSLLASRLIREIERSIGLKLPLKALFRFTTVAEMAAAIREGSPAIRLAPSDPESNQDQVLPEEDHKLLLSVMAGGLVQPSSPGSLVAVMNRGGARPPLFWCFNAPSLELPALAGELGPDQPLYGLYSGTGVLKWREQTVAQLARHYLREIRTLQPRGPYRLGGNCGGALIALELALRLSSRAEKIARLCMMEYFDPRLFTYQGRALLLYGRESHLKAYEPFHWLEPGWQEPFAVPPEADWIPGAHGEFFRKDNVKVLAAKIAAFLQ